MAVRELWIVLRERGGERLRIKTEGFAMLIEVRFQKSGERKLSAGSLEFLDEVGHVIGAASLLS